VRAFYKKGNVAEVPVAVCGKIPEGVEPAQGAGVRRADAALFQQVEGRPGPAIHVTDILPRNRVERQHRSPASGADSIKTLEFEESRGALIEELCRCRWYAGGADRSERLLLADK